jgi:hypothetical protein
MNCPWRRGGTRGKQRALPRFLGKITLPLLRTGQLGCVRPGAYADLLLLDGDPLKDLNLFRDPLKNIPFVMKGGATVRSAL